MSSKWIKDKILPGLVTLAVVNAVYAYTDVKALKREMVTVRMAIGHVKDVKSILCLLALKTKDDKLKEKICTKVYR